MKKLIAAFVFAFAFASLGAASAQAFGGGKKRPEPQPTFTPKITMQTPTYSGTGCPRGTLSSTLSPDKATLSVIYDQFQLESGQSTATVRKDCIVQVPVVIPNGWRVVEFSVDHRGFASIPAAAAGSLESKVVLTGDRGQKIIDNSAIRRFTETNADGDFTLNHKARGTATVCGGRGKLQFGTKLSLQARRTAGMMSMDTSDAGFTTVSYKLAKCN